MENHATPELTPGEQVGTILGILPEFLDHLKVEENRSPGTITRYGAHLEELAECVGDVAVSAITPDRLHIYKRHLTDRGQSPATIAATFSTVRSFLRFLRNIRRLHVLSPDRVRRPKVPKKEVEYLTKDEVARFLDAIPVRKLGGLRDRALADVLSATGMRISEATSLNRDQIDWEMKEARIVGKGSKPRKVYFSDAAIEWLSKYLQYRYDSDPALFVTHGPEPKRISGQETWRRFRKYGRKAGLTKRIYPHMLRHTMATTLLANGCPIGHIRVLLGHEHLTTTCKYYLGVMSDAEAKAAHRKYMSYSTTEGEKDAQPTEKNASEELEKPLGFGA